ncbi:MAG TPA: tripartite tricarboxylate transporter substrate binding protein [Burkholderiales bacterium]|jgi:tripartite-type tricarboxylate transporter receptor subunit TctC|nr:tripartite tricarboxylate transporter substrate binding protein [Burkholderiales bacterium]
MILRRLGLAACCSIALVCAAPAAAQSNYPSRPIHFIVPFPPGGGAESTARLIGIRLSEAVSQPVVVETRAGAGGNIGTEAVVNAAPDGYTILLSTNGTAIQPHLQKLTWDPIKDLAPVSLVATYSLVIAAHPSTPGKTLAEMVAYAKANPGKLTYGSSGTGGPLHLGAEMFKKAAGVDILHVPYKGNAPATLAILAGEVNLTFDSLVGPLPNIRAGKLRALATTGTKRAAMLPEVPTVTETGVANFSYESWNGISAPAATPKEIVQRLNTEIVRIVAMPEVRKQLSGLGYEPVSTSTAQFAERIASDYQRYGKVIKELNLKPDQ